MGISAGSMNCARVVYAMPEEPEEITDPFYKRFVPGLGLTEVQIVPHFYMFKYSDSDAPNALTDIAIPDSRHGHRFYAFPDGTYLMGCNGEEKIYGEFYLIENGVMRQVSENGQVVALPVI